jgi:arginine/lysine/histidine transporter system substrate-binding protein
MKCSRSSRAIRIFRTRAGLRAMTTRREPELSHCLFFARLQGLRWLLLAATLLAGAGTVACRDEDQSWARIQDERILRIGLDPTYPPFENAEGVPLEGLDVDLAEAVAEALGMEAAFVHFGYDGLYDALATEQVDVLISALAVSPERSRDFAYSEPYFNAGQMIFYPTGAPVAGPEGLAGRTVAVELGAEGHVLATEWQRRLPDMSILTHDTAQEALASAADGESDAAVVDVVSGRLFVSQNQALTWHPEALSDEPYAVVVRAKDTILLARINEALREVREEGRLQQIVDRWLGSPQHFSLP